MGGHIGDPRNGYRVRCDNKPTVIAIEKTPGDDGERGSMSLCDECLEAMDKQVGLQGVDIEPIHTLSEKQDPGFMIKVIDDLLAKHAEMELSLKTLRMWMRVQKQGIDIKKVKSFSWREEHLASYMKRYHTGQSIDPDVINGIERSYKGGRTTYTTKHVYTCVILKDETVIELDPPLVGPER